MGWTDYGESKLKKEIDQGILWDLDDTPRQSPIIDKM